MDNKLQEANKKGVPLIVEEVKYSQGYITQGSVLDRQANERKDSP